MADISNGMNPSEAAEKWFDAHPDQVAEWTDGAQAGNGESMNLVFVCLGHGDRKYKCDWKGSCTKWL
ncbi:hypothetical protein ACFSCZ_10970 [Siminovitchia sediminis]|uniref:Uncharacterized protein n=1 Tax=Siminovitchia sediminis TaxID=1274353 RepID=A0ABW4KIR8_9BACI